MMGTLGFAARPSPISASVNNLTNVRGELSSCSVFRLSAASVNRGANFVVEIRIEVRSLSLFISACLLLSLNS